MFGSEGSMTYILVDEKHEWIQARAIAEKHSGTWCGNTTFRHLFNARRNKKAVEQGVLNELFIRNTVIDTR